MSVIYLGPNGATWLEPLSVRLLTWATDGVVSQHYGRATFFSAVTGWLSPSKASRAMGADFAEAFARAVEGDAKEIRP